MAQHYQVSYPTIRLRLDRLIQKVGTSRQDEDSYVNLIKDLALEGEMSFEVAKKLIAGYRQERRWIYEIKHFAAGICSGLYGTVCDSSYQGE